MPRLNVNINEETKNALRQLADDSDMGVTEVMRRAISVYKFMHDEGNVDGAYFQLRDRRNGATTRLIMMP